LTCFLWIFFFQFLAIKNEEKLWMVMYFHLWCYLKATKIKKCLSPPGKVSVWSEISVHVWSANLIDLGDPKWWPLNSPIPHFRWPKVVATIVLSTHKHTHMGRERERERERERSIPISLYFWVSGQPGGGWSQELQGQRAPPTLVG
jgi:hypothetical protein